MAFLLGRVPRRVGESVGKINKQNEANKRWQQKNKEHANYLKDRSKARSFIKNKATGEDLEELKELIVTKSKELKDNY